MIHQPTNALRGRRLLVVEDEYMIATDLAAILEEDGAEILGPVGTVADALALICSAGRIDGAVLDLNLAGDRAYPVADALRMKGVPFIFATGYGSDMIPEAYASVPRCGKPVEGNALAEALALRLAH